VKWAKIRSHVSQFNFGSTDNGDLWNDFRHNTPVSFRLSLNLYKTITALQTGNNSGPMISMMFFVHYSVSSTDVICPWTTMQRHTMTIPAKHVKVRSESYTVFTIFYCRIYLSEACKILVLRIPWDVRNLVFERCCLKAFVVIDFSVKVLVAASWTRLNLTRLWLQKLRVICYLANYLEVFTVCNNNLMIL
jgi:hypothetical protein